jgi:hypothetical protein
MFRKTLTAIAFTALTIGSANALTIDTFNTTQTVSDAIGGGATVDLVSDVVNILGTDRIVSVDQLGPGATAATASFNTNPGLLTLGNTDTLSETNVLYSGIGGVGLGGVDLTEGGSDDRFALFQVAGDFPTNITISVTDTLANSGSFMISSVGLGLLVPPGTRICKL